MTSLKIPGRKYLAEATLLLATIIWGATFVIIKESLNDVSPMLFITLRFSLAALLLIPVFIFRKELMTKELTAQSPENYKDLKHKFQIN